LVILFRRTAALELHIEVSIGIKFGKNYANNVNTKMRGQAWKNLPKFRI
jgi:hypothetical protein